MFNDVLTGKASTEAPPVPPTTSAPIPLDVLLANQVASARLQQRAEEEYRRARRSAWLLRVFVLTVVIIVAALLKQAREDDHADAPDYIGQPASGQP